MKIKFRGGWRTLPKVTSLSGAFPKTAPGLPRGRASLERSDVNARQRSRLLRAVISAVAEKGYQATKITDIVERARVSRTVMYREFDGKLDCFLAAIEAGRELIMARVTEAMADVSDPSLETVLRAISRAYLERCAQEPEHTRAWVLELAAAGPRGIEVRDKYLDGFAALMKEIDGRYGSGTLRSDEHYIALVGGITELVRRQVAAETPSALPGLENALTEAAVAMLR